MLITEMGSRPNLMEVIPEQRPHLQVSRVKCFLFWNQYPGEGSTEAWGMGSREEVGSGPLGKRDQCLKGKVSCR